MLSVMWKSGRRWLCGAWAVAGLVLNAGAADLELNGSLRVKGLPLSGARVIVISADEGPKVISDGLGHFTLRLELQREYLLSFERPGCVGKQLQFNTAVPGDRVFGGFEFPFQVTLEPPPDGQQMEYAGPVGYIHYDPRFSQFGYSTDYRIASDQVLSERLEEARKELDGEPDANAKQHARATGLPAISQREEADPPVTLGDKVAPVLSRVQPMVHVVRTPGGDDAVASPTANGPGNFVREQAAVPDRPLAMAAPAAADAAPVQAAPDELPADAHMDVLVGRLNVVTIVTRRQQGRTVEYRRVANYYGAVTYFRNGYPCSADTYEREALR